MSVTTNNRGADRLAHALHNSAIEVIFSLSGNQIMPLYDALFDHPIRIVHTRHEAAAVFMAEAYAQVSGNVGIALVTAAPGFANALGALYCAAMSESPVILLSGDSPRALDGAGAFQEFDQYSAAIPFVKHSFRLTLDDDPAEIYMQAQEVALHGTQGPVHIALPVDVLESVNTTHKSIIPTPITEISHKAILENDLSQLCQLIRSAKSPIILSGPQLFRGNRRCNLDLLSSKLHTPIIDLDSPRGLRDPAKGAIKSVFVESDLVIYLGKRIDFMSGFASLDVMPNSKLIIVSDDDDYLQKAQVQHAERLQLAVLANEHTVVQSLLECNDECFIPANNKKSRTNWINRVSHAVTHRQFAVYSAAEKASHDAATSIGRAVSSSEDTILICDGGEFGQWSQAFVTAKTRITNGPSGAIGAGLPYAIGAKLAKPDAPVVAIMGDGTTGFHLSEFETAAREQLDLTIVVGNDSKWNAEHVIQVRDYGSDRTIGCSLQQNTRYDIAASGLGCTGEHVIDLDILEERVKHSMHNTGTTCINVSLPGAPAPQYSALAKDKTND